MREQHHRHIIVFFGLACLLGSAGQACSSKSGAPASTASSGDDASTGGDAVAGGDDAGDDGGDEAASADDAATGDDMLDGGGGPAADAPAPTVLPPPSHGSLLGAFVGAEPETQTDSQSEQLFTAAEALIGRRWVIDNRFYDDKTEWVNARTQWDIANNMVPMITWMPYGNGDPLDEIIAGQHDAAITAEAQKAKALGTQILMRWAHEMNGNWYPWAGSNNGGADAGAAGGPAKYVAAWRHVHDLFVQAGAKNVVWVWCINVADVPAEPWNHWSNYYPGNDYVDWIGLDAYNWGSSSSCCVWQSFSDLLDGPYQDYAGVKPLMLPETASAEVGGNKAAWIDDMHQKLETQYTAVRAVVWFDINKETDWRIDSSPATLAAYKRMALDPYFNP